MNLEISSSARRRDFGLPKQSLLLSLENPLGKSFTDFDADGKWVNSEVIVSTTSSQTAISAGTLVREWEEDGRKYYQYKSNSPIANKIPFASAEYEIKKAKIDSVDLEVYYHPTHTYNIDAMVEAMKKSLAYYRSNFGDYALDHLRIVEFPRFASYASAFPGTIMYSESMGFLAAYDEVRNMDAVFYVVAHEVSHQWWGAQSAAAKTKGSAMLSESLAQYSAYMVLKKTYGAEAVRHYLRYELDTYLSGRGSDFEQELALVRNEGQQYINYQKGGLVFYGLAQKLGEERLNKILSDFLSEYIFKDTPPFATSTDLLDRIKLHSPDSIQDYIKDSFEKVTLIDIKVTEATVSQVNSQYKISLSGTGQKYYSEDGKTGDALPLNDWIEIGLYKGADLLGIYKAKIIEGQLSFHTAIKTMPSHVVLDPNYQFIDLELGNNRKELIVKD